MALNNIFQKIETKEQYGQKMMFRNQDEKEIKVELMLKAFMKALDDKIQHVNKSGKIHIQKFTDFLMALCCEKILNV